MVYVLSEDFTVFVEGSYRIGKVEKRLFTVCSGMFISLLLVVVILS